MKLFPFVLFFVGESWSIQNGMATGMQHILFKKIKARFKQVKWCFLKKLLRLCVCSYIDPSTVCVCWMTACQRSECTHMAGGWDIPAPTPQARTPALSPAAVVFIPEARAQKFIQKCTQTLCHLPMCKSTAAAKRYIRTHSFFLFLFVWGL